MSAGFSGGGDSYRSHFTSNVLRAPLEFEASNNRLALNVVEPAANGRELDVVEDEQGRMQIKLSSSAPEFFLLLHQAHTGSISVILISDSQPLVLHAHSFTELYRDHGQTLDDDIFPRLAQVGVAPPLLPHSPAVIEEVIERLRGLPEDQHNRAVELIEQLDARDFATRQAASEELVQKVADFLPAIVQRLQSGDLSPEARMRLEEALSAHSKSVRSPAKLIESFGLLDDTAYLVSLIELTEGEGQAVVIEELKRRTGEDFGTDANRWRQWLESREDWPR